MKYYMSLLFLLVVFISCSEDSVSSNELFEVSGILVQDGTPLSSAKVVIDNKVNWEVLSKSDGSFTINNVSKGDHNLAISHYNNDGSYIELNREIAVYDNLYLDALVLPNSIYLFSPYEINHNSMKISWAKSDASDFREYKLFRHSSSGLDETTGELIHVATSISDTTFLNEDLDQFTEYFYRVYVMNNYGRLGGSNIVSATTEKHNLIWNGDFELQEDLTSWWGATQGLEIEITNSEKVNGDYSLFFNADTLLMSNSNTVPGAYLIKHFNAIEISLEVGRTYKLSGWIKTEGETKSGYGTVADSDLGGPDRQASVIIYGMSWWAEIVSPGNSEWTYFEKSFTMVQDGLNGSGILVVNSICEFAWFDDLTITAVN
jgi:hypothetical protein